MRIRYLLIFALIVTFSINSFAATGEGISDIFTVNTAFEVLHPEFSIVAEDIEFISTGGGLYEIQVTMWNYGLPATDIPIRFLEKDLNVPSALETEITTITLAEAGQDTVELVSVDWSPSSSNMQIRVIIDPNQTITEYYEDNNSAWTEFGSGGSGGAPSIVSIEALYDGIEDEDDVGYFLSGVTGANNTFKVTVSDPDGEETIDHVLFELNGQQQTINSSSSGTWNAVFDMGELELPGATLEVTAYDQSGLASTTEAVDIIVLGLPDWFWDMSGGTISNVEIVFDDGYYELLIDPNNIPQWEPFNFGYQIPEQTGGEDVLFIGGANTSFVPDMRIGFGYNVANGMSEFEFEGGWDDITLFNGPFEVGAGGGWDVTGELNPDLSFAQASGLVTLNIDLEFPTVSVSQPLGPTGLQATLEFTMMLFGNLMGQLTFGEEPGSGLQIISPTNLQTAIGVEATVAAKVEVIFGIAGAAVAASPTLTLNIEVQYTTASGTTEDFTITLEVPWEVYVYYNFFIVQNQQQLASGSFGPWSFPEAGPSPLRDDLDELDVDWPSVLMSPDLAINTDGHATVVYIADADDNPDNPRPKMYYAFWDGNEWTEPDTVTNNYAPKYDPIVEYDNEGNPVLIWTQNVIENPSQYMIGDSLMMGEILAGQEIFYSKWTGSAWDEPERLTEDNFGDGLSALAVGSNNDKIAAWTHSTDIDIGTRSDWEIQYSYQTGGAWGDVQNLTNDNQADCSVDIALYSDGTGMAVWVNDVDADFTTTSDTYLKYAIWNGAAFGPAQNIPAGNGPKNKPAIEYLEDGDAIVTWVSSIIISDTTRWQLKTSQFNHITGVWSTPEIVHQDVRQLDEPTINSANIDGENIVQLIWRGFANQREDYFSTLKNLDAGTAWTTIDQLTEDDFTDWMAATAIDANNNILLVNMTTDFDSVETDHDGDFHRDLNFKAWGITDDLDLSSELNFGVMQIAPDLRTYDDDITFACSGEDSIIYADADSTVTISIQVENNGVMPTSETEIEIWNGNPDSTGSSLITSTTSSVLEPDESEIVTAEWTATSGVHDIWVWLDPDSLTEDRNRYNNRRHTALNVVPDLKLLALYPDDDNPLADSTINLTAVVTNSGGDDAGSFILKFTEGHPDSVSSTELGTVEITSLEREANDTLSVEFTASEGIHNLYATADHGFTSADEDSLNNMKSYTLKVLPDLIIEADDISDGVDSTGAITLNAIVHNEGGVDADTFAVYFYDGNPMLEGLLIDSTDIAGIAAFDSVEASIIWEDAPLGLSVIYVLADPNNALVERDNNNNDAHANLIMQADPDLAVTPADISLNPSSPLLGDSIEVDVTIHNIGLETGMSVVARAYFDYPDSTEFLIEEQVFFTIEGGDEAVMNFFWDTDTLEAGVHTLYLQVDPENSIEETIEFNNEASSQLVLLSQPIVVTLSVDGDNIRLDWDAVAGVDEYLIYRDSNPYFSPSAPILIGTTADNFYIDENALIEQGSMKFYIVTGSLNIDGMPVPDIIGEIELDLQNIKKDK